MKHIMISIRPEWVEKILSGEKTLEIRKSYPKEECIVEIYETKSKWRQPFFNKIDKKTHFVEQFGRGKVVARWYQYIVECFTTDYRQDKEQTQRILKSACLDFESAAEYEENSRQGCLFAWHIDTLEIYETPKELSEFGLMRAPQSWCYLEDIE